MRFIEQRGESRGGPARPRRRRWKWGEVRDEIIMADLGQSSAQFSSAGAWSVRGRDWVSIKATRYLWGLSGETSASNRKYQLLAESGFSMYLLRRRCRWKRLVSLPVGEDVCVLVKSFLRGTPWLGSKFQGHKRPQKRMQQMSSTLTQQSTKDMERVCARCSYHHVDEHESMVGLISTPWPE